MVGGFIENSISGRDYGIGIRVFNGFNSAYGYTNDAREENLIKVAKEVALAAKEKKDNVVLTLMKSDIQNMHPIKLMPNTVDKKRKVELLKIGYERAKGYDELITQVTANYFDEEQNVLIANTEGLLVEDKRVRTRYRVQSVASRMGKCR